MLWFYLSLTAAVTLATVDALSKHALKDSGEEVVAWVRWGFASPFLLLLLPFIDIPHLDSTFWYATAMGVPLDAVALFLYIRAIKISPLSLTIPFMALTPVFLIVTSFLILGELPDRSGVAGIFLIATGAYLLNLNSYGRGPLAPFKAIAREKGPILIITVAFIYSISSNLGKIAVLHSSPLFFSILYTNLLSVFLLPYIMIKKRGSLSAIKKRPALFFLIGFIFAVMVLSHFSALQLADVAYMISVKRTSLIFSVIYGWLIFKEEHIKERLLGSLVMVIGVVLITLF